jgi:hypothetical protein
MDATVTLQAGLSSLYPELAGATPDLLEHAESIILRVLNEGGEELQRALLEFYGRERERGSTKAASPPHQPHLSSLVQSAGTPSTPGVGVSEVARRRLHRLTNPTYRHWSNRLELPPRPESVQRIQALWQP